MSDKFKWTPPEYDDYIAISDKDDNPTENFVYVSKLLQSLPNQVYIIMDHTGCDRRITRYPQNDTTRPAWRQIRNENKGICPECGKLYINRKIHPWDYIEYTHPSDIIIGSFALVDVCLNTLGTSKENL